MVHHQQTTAIVNDAIRCATVLNGAYRHNILRALEKTKNLLLTSVQINSQRPLALLAARRNITEAEQQISSRLVDARPARFHDQVMLVEARTLCWHALHQLAMSGGDHD
ncbi:MAG: hypothetical protein ACT4QE_09845 [Anaerolineales bacterium]